MSLKDSRWTGIAVLVLLGLLWEVAGRAGWVHKLLFPPLSVILGKLFEITVSGEILQHLGVSLWRATLGYSLAAAFAIVLGIVMGYWRRTPSFSRRAYTANVAIMTAGFVLMGYQLVGYFVHDFA